VNLAGFPHDEHHVMEVVAEFGDGQVGRGRGRASKDVLDTADQLVAFQPRNNEQADQ